MAQTNAQVALHAAAVFAAGPHIAAVVNVQDVEEIAAEFLQWLEAQDRIRQQNIKVG
jgi:hypothetical protein